MGKETKTIIYYFSGTGNNLFVARQLGRLIGNAKVCPMKELDKNPSIDKAYKNVVICVPAYHSHIPNYAAAVLEKAEIKAHQQVCSIVCCGGNRGHAIADIREIIEKKNRKIIGEYMVMLPGSYILSYNAMPNVVNQIENMLAKRKLQKIARDIKTGKGKQVHKDGMFYKDKDEPRLQAAIAEYKKIGKQFTVSNDCIGCTSCERVCPIGNIHMEGKKPMFGDNCQQCMACIQWCPKRAIDYNQTAKKRKRYHHRDVTIKEMMK